jgi:UDP-glucose 4-epimerase
MRALVTGGAGFIGSNLADALVARGDDVVVLDDLSAGSADDVPDGAHLIRGDVADEATVAEAVRGCDVVFHLAAHRSVQRSVEHPLQTDRVNTRGTLAVLVAAQGAGVRRVVSTSSSSVYGGAAPLPTPEDAPLRPRSPYAVSKVAGELYVRVMGEISGLETVVIRPFNVYGPRQRPDSAYAAVIPLFIDALRSGRAPVVHGDGRQSRDFTYVDDAVAAYLAATGTAGDRGAGDRGAGDRGAGRVYNVAGGRPHSLLDVLAVLGHILGVAVSPHHTGARVGDVRHSGADLSSAAEDLGWSPKVDLEEGLRRTVRWLTTLSAG